MTMAKLVSAPGASAAFWNILTCFSNITQRHVSTFFYDYPGVRRIRSWIIAGDYAIVNIRPRKGPALSGPLKEDQAPSIYETG